MNARLAPMLAMAVSACGSPTLYPDSIKLPVAAASTIAKTCSMPSNETLDIACVTTPDDGNAGDVIGAFKYSLHQRGFQEIPATDHGFIVAFARSEQRGCRDLIEMSIENQSGGPQRGEGQLLIEFARGRQPLCERSAFQ
ncbi:MAG: hypothetical protein ABUS57_04920 [Pseudomonadota bacterium]